MFLLLIFIFFQFVDPNFNYQCIPGYFSAFFQWSCSWMGNHFTYGQYIHLEKFWPLTNCPKLIREVFKGTKPSIQLHLEGQRAVKLQLGTFLPPRGKEYGNESSFGLQGYQCFFLNLTEFMTERPVSWWLCPETIGREDGPDIDYTFSSFFFSPSSLFVPCIT